MVSKFRLAVKYIKVVYCSCKLHRKEFLSIFLNKCNILDNNF